MDPFRKWSPMLSIRNAKTPTLVIHSQRDYRLDVSEGFQLFTALQRLNVPSKMLYFPDEGHWILKPQNSKLWYETVGDWCDRWTKTNAYAATAFEGSAAPVAARAETGSSETRKGVSRPAEMDEEKPAAPPVAGAKERLSQTGDGHASFQIAISAPSDEVQVGADARIVITLSNTSDRQILFAHRTGTDNPEFSYRIEVRNAAGREVEETAYGREAREPARRQEENRTVDYVQPGGSAVQTAHLSKLVSLSRPGWYTVQVLRKDSGSGEVVRSNEVKFAVIPPG
jgi:hypothetical protein